MKDIRILLAEGHELVRYGLRGMLEQEEDMEIVGDCSSTDEALLMIQTASPNIILMNTDVGGIEATRHLRQKQSSCKVIMLTLDKNCLTEALEAGVAAYLLEDVKCQELVQAIRRVYHGELVIDERMTSASPAPEAVSEHPSSEDNSYDSIVREAELVIPPPFDATQLLRFICQIEDSLDANIVQVIGSRKKGTAITIMLQRVTHLPNILDRLGKMPEVEGVREKPVAKHNFFSLPVRITAKPETSPRKELWVTLK